MAEAAIPRDVPTTEPARVDNVELEEKSTDSKGKGKATQEASSDDDDDDHDFDPDEATESQEAEKEEEDGESGDDDQDEDDDDTMEADESIDPTEVDSSLITEYGVGNRPRRARKDIDYSSEEALKKAGLDHA